jgi:hypothetical protein
MEDTKTPAVNNSSEGTPGDKSPGPTIKRFNNGWTKELEELFAEWADKAACYRWMHERTGRIFYQSDQSLMFPIIILSTVTGAANFALGSVVNDPTIKNYAQLGLGGLSIISGILTTIANRLGYASGSEAHRTAAISWGKFNRLIGIELSLNPNERMDAFAFMKMFRVELDRLIEQSPSIPENVITAFVVEFKTSTDVKKPDIAGELEHTKVFKDTGTRLKKIAQEAAVNIAYKKGLLKQIVLDDLDGKVRKIAEESAKNYVNSTRQNTTQLLTAVSKTLQEKVQQERKDELNTVLKANVVGALTQKFSKAKAMTSVIPVMAPLSESVAPSDVIIEVKPEEVKVEEVKPEEPKPEAKPEPKPEPKVEPKVEEIKVEEPPSESKTEPVDTLPPGWREFKSANGKPYYSNKATGKVQWTRPVETSTESNVESVSEEKK